MIKHIRINLKVINTGVKNAISKNINEKGLKQHQKMKHNSSQYEKVGNIFKCGTCEKAEFVEGLYYHIKHYHNNKQQFELNMPVKSICDNCKEYFSTLKLLEDHTKTQHPDHYAKAPNTTMQLKTCPCNTCITKICS